MEEQKTPEEPKEKKEEAQTKTAKPINKKFIAILVIIVSALVLYANYGSGLLNNNNGEKKLGKDAPSAEEIEKLIDENLLSDGFTSEITEITEENGLYKFKLTVNDTEYESYMTKDKELFFPEAINFAEIKKEKASAEETAKKQTEEQKASIEKNEKPEVEVFVMSHCPYGTQIEKGIIPVAKSLGDKIDFEIKFCDYAMHGEEELNEQMNQYCISENQEEKFIPYLECFLAEGDGEGCLAETGINQTQLASCVRTTDNKYKISAGFKDESTWKNGSYPTFSIFQEEVDAYGISGSPSLVINGKKISSSRDSQSLLEMVCAGFENAPEECNQELSSTTPSAGFGYEGSGADSDASCG